ncbi:MAG: glycosyl transferase family 2, partial [Candidatus Tectimicrobiota bacterium]
MSLLNAGVLTIYFAVLIVLALYGLHRYLMVYLYYKHRSSRPRLAARLDRLPAVTVQLPVYTEMYVVE